MTQFNRAPIAIVGICLIFGLIYTTACHAESKSEMIKRLRSQSCSEDVGRTTTQLDYLQQLKTDINQLVKQIEIISPQALFIDQARDAETVLMNLLAALTNHKSSKLTICERLVPGSESATSEYPEGYEGLSKSERIRQLKTDYCTDVRQNGESIRKEIPTLKETMKKILSGNPPDESLNAPIRQLRDQWSQIIPIVDDLYNEQMLASELCKGIEQGISKSELIRISKQGLEDGGQLPYFWYLLKYN